MTLLFSCPLKERKNLLIPTWRKVNVVQSQFYYKAGIWICFSCNCLFRSPYKINCISSVWKGILCQDNPNYSLGCLVNVNRLNWRNEASFAEDFVLLRHGAFLNNILDRKVTSSQHKVPQSAQSSLCRQLSTGTSYSQWWEWRTLSHHKNWVLMGKKIKWSLVAHNWTQIWLWYNLGARRCAWIFRRTQQNVF